MDENIKKRENERKHEKIKLNFLDYGNIVSCGLESN